MGDCSIQPELSSGLLWPCRFHTHALTTWRVYIASVKPLASFRWFCIVQHKSESDTVVLGISIST